MLLTNEIFVNVNPQKDRTYYKLGYYDRNIQSEPFNFKIKIEDLIVSSRLYVNVKCDVCNTEKKIQYCKYIKNYNNGGIYCCSSICAHISGKNKKTNLKKYGNENYNNRKKSIETCIEKYGVDNVQKVKEINIKSHEQRNEKEILNKTRKITRELYGKEHALQIDKFKEKSNKTKKEEYGDENYNNREKCKQTCIEKYGVDNVQKLIETKNKKKKYIIQKNKNIISIDDDFNYFINCDNEKNHVYKTYPTLHYNRILSKTICCTICNPINSSKSGLEHQLYEYIKSIYSEKILRNKRTIIKPYELDIYLPNLKLGIEFNGLYHHSDKFKSKNYHLNKTELAEKNDIKLIHIYEDDWLYKVDIVKSMILYNINELPKIYMTNYNISNVNKKMAKSFIEENSLEKYKNCKYNIGMYNEVDDLIAILSINYKFQLNHFCMIKFHDIVDSEKTLFEHFIKKYKPYIITHIRNRDWVDYVTEKLNFKIIEKLKPEIRLTKKSYKIYNSGYIKYMWKKE